MAVLIPSGREPLNRALLADVARGQDVGFVFGSFPLSRFAPLLDCMPGARRIRLVLGCNYSMYDSAALAFRQGCVELAEKAVQEERLPNRSELRARLVQLTEGINRAITNMRQTDADASYLRHLLALLEMGSLSVKAFLRNRIDSDCVVCSFGKGRGAAIKGAGSILLPDQKGASGLWVRMAEDGEWDSAWEEFDALWASATPFSEQIADIVRRSWAVQQVKPYTLYLSVLNRLVQDRIDDAESTDDSWMEGFPALTDFQQVAVHQALTILRQHGGVIVADVVGLGKTYIGASMLKILSNQGRRATIFCPPALVAMWEEFNHLYALSAVVVSTGILAGENAVDLSEPVYQTHDRTVVLVDESHRFRNAGTSSYTALSDYCQGRSCILLTATPFNLRPRDLYSQIRLFADDDMDLGLNPPRLREFFTHVEKGSASLVDVLRPLMIRRTRGHIQKHYPNATIPVRQQDGTVVQEPLVFPRRDPPEVLAYQVGDVYGEQAYDDIVDRISGRLGAVQALTYGRYNVGSYLRPEYRDVPPYTELRQVGTGVRGFVRVLLFKRLESSVEAFRATVRKLIQVNERFLTAVRAGIVPAGDQAQSVIYGEGPFDDADLIEELEELGVRYASEAFDTGQLVHDIQHDIIILQELDARITPVTPDRDGKLQRLRSLLQDDLDGQKALVFTQYEATARYIAANIRDLPHTAWLSGGAKNNRRSFTSVIGRFAPTANPRLAKPGQSPVDILVSTDVLSEGLNLQDCSNVINYDLHWNPVRLIQRAGRVDRLGSQAERIRLFNFLPQRAVERELGLEGILRRRIDEIHSYIGEDNAILHPDERLNPDEMYASYTVAPDELDQDPSALAIDFAEVEEYVRQIRRNRPDLQEEMAAVPQGARAARKATAKAGFFVHFTCGGYERLALLDSSGATVATGLEEVLPALECGEEEPSCPLPANYSSVVSRALQSFAVEAAQRSSDRQAGPPLTAGQKYALRQLADLRKGETRDSQLGVLDSLDKAVRGRLPEAAVRELNRIRRLGLMGDVFRQRLMQAYTDMDLARYSAAAQDVAEAPLARVFCSEAFV